MPEPTATTTASAATATAAASAKKAAAPRLTKARQLEVLRRTNPVAAVAVEGVDLAAELSSILQKHTPEVRKFAVNLIAAGVDEIPAPAAGSDAASADEDPTVAMPPDDQP